MSHNLCIYLDLILCYLFFYFFKFKLNIQGTVTSFNKGVFQPEVADSQQEEEVTCTCQWGYLHSLTLTLEPSLGGMQKQTRKDITGIH